MYSLGNFVFDGFVGDREGQTGWLWRMTLDKQGVVAWDTFVVRLDEQTVCHGSTWTLPLHPASVAATRSLREEAQLVVTRTASWVSFIAASNFIRLSIPSVLINRDS